mmetsp:Transcript_28012/g.69301  ORF Transcript_28012/g.69301 Transcript_28012/m.69301 type:complete len:263 (-) Transcript_28012:26-814(-)
MLVRPQGLRLAGGRPGAVDQGVRVRRPPLLGERHLLRPARAGPPPRVRIRRWHALRAHLARRRRQQLGREGRPQRAPDRLQRRVLGAGGRRRALGAEACLGGVRRGGEGVAGARVGRDRGRRVLRQGVRGRPALGVGAGRGLGAQRRGAADHRVVWGGQDGAPVVFSGGGAVGRQEAARLRVRRVAGQLVGRGVRAGHDGGGRQDLSVEGADGHHLEVHPDSRPLSGPWGLGGSRFGCWARCGRAGHRLARARHAYASCFGL